VVRSSAASDVYKRQLPGKLKNDYTWERGVKVGRLLE
jgi:hypothetical protein